MPSDVIRARFASKKTRQGKNIPARERDGAWIVRDPHEAVLDHGVAASVFGGVERGIGGFDQVARALGVVRLVAGDADADGDGLVAQVACGSASAWTAARTVSPISSARAASVFGSSRQNSSPP